MLITREMCFDPSLLDKNIIGHLHTIAKSNFENTKTKEDGIIKKVNRVSKILNNYVSKTTGSIIFKVELDVDSIYPKVGDVFKMKINKIDTKSFQEGERLVVKAHVIIATNDVFNIIISPDNILNHTFNPNTTTFFNNLTKTHIKVGDEVNVTITTFRFENNMFKYIGKIC